MTVDEQIEHLARAMIEASWRGGCDKAHVVLALWLMYL